MEYFYIACSAASLAALAGYVLEPFFSEIRRTARCIVFIVFTTITLVFWFWFYVYPTNPVRERIAERSSYAGLYSDGRNFISVVEGTFVIGGSPSEATILLPPFDTPPKVMVFRENTGGSPEIVLVTTDSFSVRIDAIRLAGTWQYRARGHVLSKIDGASNGTNSPIQ